MNDTRPIGIFDSGLGGLTVAKEIIKLLPGEDIVYLGDTARVPYGTRSEEIVRRFSLEDANFLLKHNVKIIVIACNTASAWAGEFLKKEMKVPVFEVISGAAKDAVASSRNKKIGVIGTRGTVGSGAYESKIKALESDIQVVSEACPLFVPFIEEGEISGEPLNLIAKKYLKKIKDSGVDTLILGCTHYPIIRSIIEKETAGIKLIDPGESEAVSVKDYLEKEGLETGRESGGKHSYFVTDLNSRFKKVAEMFLGGKIELNDVDMEK
jgi:glutamate racemase